MCGMHLAQQTSNLVSQPTYLRPAVRESHVAGELYLLAWRANTIGALPTNVGHCVARTAGRADAGRFSAWRQDRGGGG